MSQLDVCPNNQQLLLRLVLFDIEDSKLEISGWEVFTLHSSILG